MLWNHSNKEGICWDTRRSIGLLGQSTHKYCLRSVCVFCVCCLIESKGLREADLEDDGKAKKRKGEREGEREMGERERKREQEGWRGEGRKVGRTILINEKLNGREWHILGFRPLTRQ